MFYRDLLSPATPAAIREKGTVTQSFLRRRHTSGQTFAGQPDTAVLLSPSESIRRCLAGNPRSAAARKLRALAPRLKNSVQTGVAEALRKVLKAMIRARHQAGISEHAPRYNGNRTCPRAFEKRSQHPVAQPLRRCRSSGRKQRIDARDSPTDHAGRIQASTAESSLPAPRNWTATAEATQAQLQGQLLPSDAGVRRKDDAAQGHFRSLMDERPGAEVQPVAEVFLLPPQRRADFLALSSSHATLDASTACDEDMFYSPFRAWIPA